MLSINTIKKKLFKNFLFEYFQLQYVPFENTIYEEIKKMKNSSFFVYDLNLKSLSINEYKKKDQTYEFKNYNEIIEVGKNFLNNSIKKWSQSDVQFHVLCHGLTLV